MKSIELLVRGAGIFLVVWCWYWINCFVFSEPMEFGDRFVLFGLSNLLSAFSVFFFVVCVDWMYSAEAK